MSDYMTFIDGQIENEASFRAMLPDPDSLNFWQRVQHQQMVEMWMTQADQGGIYEWPQVGDDYHDGMLRDMDFRGKTICRAYPDEYRTNCCGLSLEHFFRSWRAALTFYDLFESNVDVSVEDWKVAKGNFFVYRDHPEYHDGGGKGAVYLWQKFFENIKRLRGPAELQNVQNKLEVQDTAYTTDPYQMKFGDYIQFQNKPSPIQSGHASIFVGLEQRNTSSGRTFDAVRAFNSNVRNDYKMPPGIGFCWYTIGRVDRDTGHTRIIKAGGPR